MADQITTPADWRAAVARRKLAERQADHAQAVADLMAMMRRDPRDDYRPGAA